MIMSHDVFISYSSKNEFIAEELCSTLESKKIGCWFAKRDVPLGEMWPEQIVRAINRSRAVVLILSAESNTSDQVKREVERAVSKRIPILALRIEDVGLSETMEYFISSVQQLDAFLPPLHDHLDNVSRQLEQLLNDEGRRRRRRSGNAKTARADNPKPRPKLNHASSRLQVGDRFEPTPVGEPTPTHQETGFTNPYEFDTTASYQTFKGRHAEIDDILDSIESGTHTAIFGLQRMGKTSLMEEGLEERLKLDPQLAARVLMAKIDFQRLGGEQVKYGDLVRAIIGAIAQAMSAGKLGRSTPDVRMLTNELFRQNDQGDRTQFFAKFTNLIYEMAKASQRQIVLFIDEFSEIRKAIEQNRRALVDKPMRNRNLLPHDLYLDVPFMHHLSSMLRDRNLKRKLTLIVAVRPFMAEYDDKEDLQILKLMRPITLYYLDEAAAKALIVEPMSDSVGYEAGAVDYLYRLTGGHPYLLQFILKSLIDRCRRERRYTITRQDIESIERRMISEGPAYDAQFEVVISDYSVDEITIPQEARLGKGTLALIAKIGAEQEQGWVFENQIVEALAKHEIPREKAASLLSQFVRVKILEEKAIAGNLSYRMSIPLLRKRFVEQNLYLKYFRRSRFMES
jgi:TIR domain